MGRGAVVVGIVACCAVGVQPAAARPKEDRSGGTPGGALDLAIAVSAAAFSPNGDGRLDAVTIHLTVEPPDAVEISVRDDGGAIHRRWTTTSTSDIPWDGRSDQGAILPDGRYVVHATSVGHPEPVAASVGIDTHAPRVRLVRISPDPFIGRGVTRIRLRTSDAADRLSATTTVHDRVGRVFQTGTDVAVGGATISVRPRYANGGRLFPGRYLVEVTVGDEAGNESSGRGRPWRVHRSMPARVIRRLDRAGARVALTIDDCHVRDAWSRILTVLRRQNAGATFFCPGTRVMANPDLARRTVADGHAIGSHGWDHAVLTGRSFDGVAWRLRKDAAAMWRVARDTTAPFFRPPAGALDRPVRAAAGATSHPRVMLWDVDPQDWRRPPPGAIVSSVLRDARPGSIVILHTLPGTARALPRIITGLRAKGLDPVGLPELFRAAGLP
ncbi:MAG TPA: polysaccharide deacetylase family protein [Actinomycetota bacterium]|nr:polysaccharide deacetylase family protein [Actinomycetota bacterium]